MFPGFECPDFRSPLYPTCTCNVNFVPWIRWLVLSWRVRDVTIDGINQMFENWNTGFPALGHVAQPKKNIIEVEVISSLNIDVMVDLVCCVFRPANQCSACHSLVKIIFFAANGKKRKESAKNNKKNM